MAPSLMPARGQTPIAHFRPTDTLFSTPTYTLLAKGGRALTTVSLPDLPEAVPKALTGHGRTGLVIGAISFDGSASRLRFAERVTRHEPLTVRPCLRCASAVWRVAAKPSAEDHIATVRLIRDRIAAGEANRIVLAQTLTATGSHGLDVTDLLIHLSGRAPYTFALPLGHGRTLVGTSAELLIARHGRALTTHPLAGAAPRHPTSFADQKAARDLLNSRKKRYEHRLVVESAAATLAPFCRDLRVPKQPQLQATATMWHLGSRITATLTDPPPTSLGLAAELHPPPTSCGTPTQAARTLITELEHGNGVRRGWYAGLVGWQNAAGDGEWALALCCAVTESPRRLRLWAGAGITAASEPADVLLETSTQLATMLQALHAIPRLH